MRYVVASVDVLGNEEIGWDVNDTHQIGTIDISDEVINDDQLILDVLNEAQYTDNVTVEDYFIEGDDSYMTVRSEEDGRPMLALISADTLN